MSADLPLADTLSAPPSLGDPLPSLSGRHALLIGVGLAVCLIVVAVGIDYYLRKRAGPQTADEAQEWLRFKEWQRATKGASTNGGIGNVDERHDGVHGDERNIGPTGPDIGSSPAGY